MTETDASEVSSIMAGGSIYTFEQLGSDPIHYKISRGGTPIGACSIDGSENFQVFDRWGHSIRVSSSKPGVKEGKIVGFDYYMTMAAWQFHDKYQR